MLKCGAIGSYAQNQALWAHVWAKKRPESGPHRDRISATELNYILK
jgi:hypothetical protein